jgi:hypothetical protein
MIYSKKKLGLTVLLLSWSLTALAQNASPSTYFKIKVIDKATGRGIPMVKVELESHNYTYTDSAGVVAFYEPGLMNRTNGFTFISHGYELDGGITHPLWDTKAVLLDSTAGTTATVEMNRINIAQRLYRCSGYGVYRDSVLLGESSPITYPLVNAQMAGQDTIVNTIHNGEAFMIWGDTHTLQGNSNLKGTAARSYLPDAPGGIDPDDGFNLRYITKAGSNPPSVKKMVPDRPGLIWMRSLVSAKDDQGNDHLIASYQRKGSSVPENMYGLLEFNESTEEFEYIFEETQSDAENNRRVFGYTSTSMKLNNGAMDHFYYHRYHLSRSATDYASVTNPATYEGFTCLVPGEKMEGSSTQVNRDGSGNLIWSWQTLTAPVGIGEMDDLESYGLIDADERWTRPVDVETGLDFSMKRGPLMYNPYRQRYCMIMMEVGAERSLSTSYWYLEADTPQGPWVFGRRIVQHDDYTFYNPCLHPYLSKDNGREIFFEGTVTMSYTRRRIVTEGYNYNQMMYKLDLDDERLMLPLPVYALNGAPNDLRTGEKFNPALRNRTIHFYAYDRFKTGAVAMVYDDGLGRLTPLTNSNNYPNASFFALPTSTTAPGTTLLYESYDSGTQTYSYSLQAGGTPICKVWSPPVDYNPYNVVDNSLPSDILPPQNLTATPGDSLVELDWEPSAGLGETGYNVLRSTPPNGSFAVISSGITDTFYTDATAANNTSYFYIVQADYGSSITTNSEQVVVRPIPSGNVFAWGPSTNIVGNINTTFSTAGPVTNNGLINYIGGLSSGALADHNFAGNYDTNIAPALYGVIQHSTNSTLGVHGVRKPKSGYPHNWIRVVSNGGDKKLSTLIYVKAADFSNGPLDATVNSYAFEMAVNAQLDVNATERIGQNLHAAIQANGSQWYVSETVFDKSATGTIPNLTAERWTALTEADLSASELMTVVGETFGTVSGLTNITAAGFFYDNNIDVGVDAFRIYTDTSPTPFQQWADSMAIYNSDATANADPDLDGIVNLLEWSLDGNPLVPNSAAKLQSPFVSGTNFVYIYPRLKDLNRPIYELIETDGLIGGTWTNKEFRYTITAADETYEGRSNLEAVTNEIPIDSDHKFIQLKITNPDALP